jgi:hemoglobin-like flavoprotein
MIQNEDISLVPINHDLLDIKHHIWHHIWHHSLMLTSLFSSVHQENMNNPKSQSVQILRNISQAQIKVVNRKEYFDHVRKKHIESMIDRSVPILLYDSNNDKHTFYADMLKEYVNHMRNQVNAFTEDTIFCPVESLVFCYIKYTTDRQFFELPIQELRNHLLTKMIIGFVYVVNIRI